MTKRTLILLILVALAFGSFYAVHGGWLRTGAKLADADATNSGASASARRPRPSVEVATTTQSVTSTDISAIGSLLSDESVDVTSESAGRISQILFQEGNQVKTGDVLVRLDDTLALAELKDGEARLQLAQSTYERNEALQKSGAATKQSFDEAASNLEVAKAAVELARTRIEKLAVKAPFDGVLGFRAVSVGAYVQPGTKLVNLEKLDELKVAFSVPELFLSQIGPDQKVEVSVDAWPEDIFSGTIYAINPQVDVNGRALQVRAKLANTERKLRPGLLARVVVKGSDKKDVVMVPESAIVPRGSATFVYRVENGKALETAVTIGKRRAGTVEILEGLSPNVQVVTAGQSRLQDGSEVEVVESLSGAGG